MWKKSSKKNFSEKKTQVKNFFFLGSESQNLKRKMPPKKFFSLHMLILENTKQIIQKYLSSHLFT